MDYPHLLSEVNQLRQEVALLRRGRKQPCQGVTGKGTPCRNGALADTPYCRMHSRAPKPPKAPRVKKEPKPKKIVPEHTHAVGSFDPLCPLCSTHGDCLDPSLPHHDFECTRDLSEILCQTVVCGVTESV